MATKKAAAKKPTKKLKPEAFGEGTILKGKSVFHGGKAYNPGDEAKLAAAGLTQESLQMLANKGVIEGFGVTAQEIYAEEEVEEESEE